MARGSSTKSLVVGTSEGRIDMSLRHMRKNGADGASGNDPKHPSRDFAPSSSQLRYLLALEAALAARQSVSDTAMAKALKMSRTTIWEWKMDAAFNAWLQGRLDQTSDEHWPLILRRHEHLAMQGSVRSAEFILKARTLARPATGGVSEDADPSSHYTVNILVPRPPDLPIATDEGHNHSE